MMNSTRKMKNNTCAMLDAVAAIPPNPKMPATMATTRKINAQYNIVDLRPESRTISALRATTRGLLSQRMPQAESSLGASSIPAYLEARFLDASLTGGASSALLLR
jgi:hypothetical protein